jgi:hypothetical protein
MALTLLKRFDEVAGSAVAGPRITVRRHLKVTFDNSYPTGGEALAASDCDLDELWGVEIASPPKAGTELVAWDPENLKLLIFTADGTQAVNASDQSAVVVDIVAIGVDTD